MSFTISPETLGATVAVVVPVTGMAVAYMRLAMNNAIQGLKLDLIKELNGTYTRRGECLVAHNDVRDRLTRLEVDSDG